MRHPFEGLLALTSAIAGLQFAIWSMDIHLNRMMMMMM
jgi:hypothetical protein